MKFLALVFLLTVAGCAHGKKSAPQFAQVASEIHSPYGRYLPQAPPSETNRVKFPQGYSIVSPVGWVTRTIPMEDWMKDNVTDQIEIEGDGPVGYKPRITIQHLGPGENSLYLGFLAKLGQIPPDGWVPAAFQKQPALKKFYEGSGSRQAIRGSYQPWLTQEIFCERDEQGFLLIFDMKNADKYPYFKQPLPIVEQYLETFCYQPPKK
jgi:hypothetical protein